VRRFEVRHPRLGGHAQPRQRGPAVATTVATRRGPRSGREISVSVLIGVLVYDEHRRRGPGSGALLLALMILLVIAVIAVIGLGRVETTNEVFSVVASLEG